MLSPCPLSVLIVPRMVCIVRRRCIFVVVALSFGEAELWRGSAGEGVRCGHVLLHATGERLRTCGDRDYHHRYHPLPITHHPSSSFCCCDISLALYAELLMEGGTCWFWYRRYDGIKAGRRSPVLLNIVFAFVSMYLGSDGQLAGKSLLA